MAVAAALGVAWILVLVVPRAGKHWEALLTITIVATVCVVVP